MTRLSDFHAHTTYADGANTAEEMVKAAIERGLTAFGISEHSYDMDADYTMRREAIEEYKAELAALKKKYAGQIDLLCGIEQDYFSSSIELPTDGYDYVIGATHYLITDHLNHIITGGRKQIVIDISEEDQAATVNGRYGGDYYEYAEDYYYLHGKIASQTKCDIVAHFDLVNKFNEGGKLFDTSHKRYRAAAIDAMREILKDCNVFEVNTGAMYRLGRTEPYPQLWLLRELRKRGGEVILSSDAHSTEGICYKFAEMEELLRAAGYKYRKSLTKDGFVDVKL